MRIIIGAICVFIAKYLFALPYYFNDNYCYYSLNPIMEELNKQCLTQENYNLEAIQKLLQEQGSNLKSELIKTVLLTLQCSEVYTAHHNILAIIDYSLPANQKRLWVFNLFNQKLLFHTYVSHGLKSGARYSQYFSNINDSKASSIGVYETYDSYFGREGLTLRLRGLDKGFNDQAMNRYIVLHGAWYVDPNFIKRYGRAGRSWGCPAVPLDVVKPLINKIKNQALLIIYYPEKNWLKYSRLLHCQSLDEINSSVMFSSNFPEIKRKNIIFIDSKPKGIHTDAKPILVMESSAYQHIFQHTTPLSRMLRRQIAKKEYVAITPQELKILIIKSENDKSILANIMFIVPEIKMEHGSYLTHMKPIILDKIKTITCEKNKGEENFILEFESKPSLPLATSSKFIRWLGL